MAQDAVFGKKTVFGVGMTEVLVAGFDGIQDSTVTRAAGFAKVLARDAVLGKKTVSGLEMTEVRVARPILNFAIYKIACVTIASFVAILRVVSQHWG